MTVLEDKKVDIAGVCETWLSDINSPITAVIKNHGYSIIHNFRKDMRGGGTALIFKSCYSMTIVDFSINPKSLEYTSAMIRTAGATKVLFIIIYHQGI